MANELLTMEEIKRDITIMQIATKHDNWGADIIDTIRALHDDGLKACDDACNECAKGNHDGLFCGDCRVKSFRAKLDAMGGTDGKENDVQERL